MDGNVPKMQYQFSGYKMAFILSHEDKGLIEDYFNLFYNHNGTNSSGKLYWIHEHSAYFWTDKEMMLKALKDIFLHRIMDLPNEERAKMFCGEHSAGSRLAEKLAYEAFEKITCIAGAFRLTGALGHEYKVHDPS